jgi:hypothetical protein
MSLPRELREAIPNSHAGRAPELDSMSGDSSNVPLFGPLVKLKFVVKETGKLTGQFIVLTVQSDAARALADKLTKLANAGMTCGQLEFHYAPGRRIRPLPAKR